MSWSGKFSDCRACRFYAASGPGPNCRRCGAGEYFEERVRDYQPDDNELMQIYRRMTKDD